MYSIEITALVTLSVAAIASYVGTWKDVDNMKAQLASSANELKEVLTEMRAEVNARATELRDITQFERQRIDRLTEQIARIKAIVERVEFQLNPSMRRHERQDHG